MFGPGCMSRIRTGAVAFLCGTSGPPGEAGQSLSRYPLRIDNGLLYIELPVETLSASSEARGEIVEQAEAIRGPGHDPCLAEVRSCQATCDGGDVTPA